MPRVVSVHEYELKPGMQPVDFERALRAAEQRGLFDLPGLREHYFLRGLKGARRPLPSPATDGQAVHSPLRSAEPLCVTPASG